MNPAHTSLVSEAAQRSRMIAASFALAGTLIALYLLLHDLGLSSIACPIAGCDTVQASVYSRWFNVPVAAFGLVAFVVLLALSLVGLFTNRAVGLPVRASLLSVSGLSLLAYLPLTYLELFVIHAVCFWCVTSSLTMLGVFLGTVASRD
jgi:uncharacterized membrane protein